MFLLPFYIKSYEVADYFLYNEFAQLHFPAKNGASSLFLLISNIIINHSFLTRLSMLIFMTIGLYLFLKQQKYIENKILKISYIVFILSLGTFWYFYGKIFYEFPFMCLIFGVIFNLTIKKIKYLYLNFFLAGLCLSFKPYSIFLLMSYFLILLCFKPKIFKIIIKKLPILSILFVIGYILGNYNLLFDFTNTIKEIRAFPAGCEVHVHLFYNYKKRLLWDNVLNFSYNSGICNVITSIFILFILPLFIKNKKKIYLLAVNFLTMSLYLLFIRYFSPGDTWHGFCVSLYLICFLGLISIYHGREFNNKVNKIILLFCLIQTINNFIYYLPTEIVNFIKTDNAYKAFNNDKEEIIETIYKNIEPEDKFAMLYNMQRRDVKTGKYVIETSENFRKIEPQMGDKSNYNIFFLIEYPNYTQKQRELPLTYSTGIIRDEKREIYIKKRINYDNGAELIYDKDNIKVYKKRAGSEIYNNL